MTPGYADAMGSAPQAGALAAGLSKQTDSESTVGTTAGDGSGAYISEGTAYEPEPEQDAGTSEENGDAPDRSHTERTRFARLLLWGLLPILLLAAACAALAALRKTSPLLFSLYGPTCFVSGKCPEGKMTCGQQAEIRKKFSK